MWKVIFFLFCAVGINAQLVQYPQMANGQAGEAFTAPTWVYPNSGTKRYYKADADSDTMPAVAVSFISSTASGDFIQVYFSGMALEWPTALQKGAVYYLSTTAGAMTATLPTVGSYQRLGYAQDTFVFIISIAPRVVISSGGVSDGGKGDITVSGSGTTWGINNDAVTSAKIADNAVGPTELESTAVVAATYGSATQVPVITVDQDGRITGVTNTLIGRTIATEYTTAQTNTAVTVPTGAVSVSAVVVGGGGGGGSGRKGAAASVRCGGGGGGAGGYSCQSFSLSQLGSPATIYVTVGAGGNGGAAVSANSTNGGTGLAGGSSGVSTTVNAADRFISASGAGTAGGGTAAAGTGASATSTQLSMFTGIGGGSASGTGGVGTVGGVGLLGASGGGASGGGITTGNVASAGGTGGTSYYTLQTGGSSGAIATNGGAGGRTFGRPAGSGGGGGGSSLVGNAGTGGAGTFGSGGGGGGAAVDSVGNSGAGGNGGAGYVLLIFSF